MSVIENLEPKLLWKYFDDVRKIPRCSKHEEKIREYLVNFAKEQKLDYKTDKPGNVVITKPASPGMEDKPIVILQSHMDMVCEKNSDVEHDFSKDPIKLKIKGDILLADGTTLGADDGIGVATSLAILEDRTLKHGPIEALFTVDEETGLTGAFALESDMLSGKIMLNIDSEDFGILTVGCAGGGDTKIKLPIKKESIDKNLIGLSIKISGLRGGHSGVDIHEQRANAIKLLSRILWKTSQNHEFYLFDIKGGDKHNAIPRESYAKVCLDSNDKDKFLSDIKSEEKTILAEVKSIDPKFKVNVESIDNPNSALTKESKISLGSVKEPTLTLLDSKGETKEIKIAEKLEKGKYNIEIESASRIAAKAVEMIQKDLDDPNSDEKPAYRTDQEWEKQLKSSLNWP